LHLLWHAGEAVRHRDEEGVYRFSMS